jgi:alkyl hydroperoxide reductase subunit AhpF
MPIIQEKDHPVIRERLRRMTGPVTLASFTQAADPPPYSEETTAVLQELAALSDLLSVRVYDFQTDPEAVDRYGVERIPAIVVEGARDYGVRYYGFPGGYEFAALIDDIVDVSKGDSGLTADTRERLATLTKPVHLRVFSTPT